MSLSSENNPDIVTAVEPDRSLRGIIGENVNLRELFSVEKMKSCQQIIDNARDEFFEHELPKIPKIKELVATGDENKFHDIEILVNDIRSQARIFGFPFVTLACSYIVDFCEDKTKSAQTRFLIISRFLEILHIALKNKVRDEGGALEKELKLLSTLR